MSNSVSVDSNNYLEQLGQLRALTIRMNVIHEAQALQIRNYPILIPGVKSAVSEVDIENRSVLYKLNAKDKSFSLEDPVVKTVLENIKIYITQAILWPDTKVYFAVQGHGTKNAKSNRKKRTRK